MLKRMVVRLQILAMKAWYKAFEPYDQGLAVQAIYLYRQSTLYKDRWQLFGVDFAEETFRNNHGEGSLFFRQAKKQPFSIRYRIFMDACAGREPRPYYLEES